jgi:hypothetical protein
VITEAATNLVKHAVGGQLLWRALERNRGVGLEILALDRGPGISNVGECLRNGYSTAGSLGTGLGAIARLATEFDIYSLPGKGTALLARLWSGPLAIAELNPAQQALRFAGVGNIAGVVVDASRRHPLVSHNGIIGHTLRKVQEFAVPWSPGALLIMHSDGLGTQWDLDAYPGLLGRDPSLIAGVLYRDYRRGYDDVTVLVAKQRC